MIIDPTIPDRIFAGGVSGGIWRSEDGGNTWTPVADEMSNLAVTCMVAMFGTEPDTFFAGTGEGGFFKQKTNTKNSPVPGAGVFRSIDGGNTWTHLRKTSGPTWTISQRLDLSRDETILLAATGSGIFREAPIAAKLGHALIVGGLCWTSSSLRQSQIVLAGRGDGGALYSLDNGLTWSRCERFRSRSCAGQAGVGPGAAAPKSMPRLLTLRAQTARTTTISKSIALLILVRLIAW